MGKELRFRVVLLPFSENHVENEVVGVTMRMIAPNVISSDMLLREVQHHTRTAGHKLASHLTLEQLGLITYDHNHKHEEDSHVRNPNQGKSPQA